MSRFPLLMLAIFLVSTAGLFAHRALAEATPLAIAAWRLGLASVFFVGWNTFSRKQRTDSAERDAPLSTAVRLRLCLAGICLALHFITWFIALRYTLVARATLLVCTTPLWTTLGSLLLGRRHRIRSTYWLALMLAIFGIWLVTKNGAEGPSPNVLRGDLLAILGGMLFATYLLSVEGLHTVISARRQVTFTYSVAGVLLWILLMLNGGATLSYSAGVWYAILGMTLGPQIFGHTLLNSALRHFPSSTVAFSILLEPVIAAFLAWLIFHQAVSPGQMFGGIFVLIGLGLVIAQQTPNEHSEDEPVG